MNKPLFLSKKTAKELIKRELGVSASVLKELGVVPEAGVYMYEFSLGTYTVIVRNDWARKRDHLIELEIMAIAGGGSIHRFFDPETLEEDFKAGEEYRRETREEICESCWLKQKEYGI